MKMDNLAKKLIDDHRNPIVKNEAPCSKLFLKSSTTGEAEFIEFHLNKLENILKHERAERRCARSQAVWSPEDKLAKVTKSVKTLSHFGYKDKNGTYLYPEEALFLMETNRLEVTLNGIPLSMQEGYDLLLKYCERGIIQYKTYKKLVLLGYRLLRHSELCRKLLKATNKCNISENDSIPKKRSCIEENDEVDVKKRKLTPKEDDDYVESFDSPRSSAISKQIDYITDIFKIMRENAPKEYVNEVTVDVPPQYYVFLPNNKSKCEYDFNLYICDDSILSTKGRSRCKPSIFAISREENISFYRLSNVNLPFL